MYLRIRPSLLLVSLLAAGVMTATASAIRAEPESASRVDIRAAFHAMLARPRVPLAPTSTVAHEADLVVEHGEFHSEAGQTVPFLLMKKAGAAGRLPAVIA